MLAEGGRATGPRLLRKRNPVNLAGACGGASPRLGLRLSDGQVRFRHQCRFDGYLSEAEFFGDLPKSLGALLLEQWLLNHLF